MKLTQAQIRVLKVLTDVPQVSSDVFQKSKDYYADRKLWKLVDAGLAEWSEVGKKGSVKTWHAWKITAAGKEMLRQGATQ